jgi:hypothetical protein
MIDILSILADKCPISALRSCITLYLFDSEQQRVVHHRLALQEFDIMLQSLMNCKLLLHRYSNPEAGRALELAEVTVLKSLSTPLDGLAETLGDQVAVILGNALVV